MKRGQWESCVPSCLGASALRADRASAGCASLRSRLRRDPFGPSGSLARFSIRHGTAWRPRCDCRRRSCETASSLYSSHSSRRAIARRQFPCSASPARSTPVPAARAVRVRAPTMTKWHAKDDPAAADLPRAPRQRPSRRAPPGARRTALTIVEPSASFRMYPPAPACRACSRAMGSAKPESIRMRIDGRLLRAASITRVPSPSGSRRSSSKTSASIVSIAASAVATDCASPTTVRSPVRSRRFRRP